MLEWLILLPLALIGLIIAGVFVIAASVIWFLVALPFRLLGWLFGAICFVVFMVPVILLLALGALAAAAVLVLPVLPLLALGGLIWLVVRMARRGRAATAR
jgi:hypothetical protein